MIDYGNLVYNPAGQCEVNVRYLRPGFFIKTAIDLMLASAGYKGTGSLLSNPLYPKLIAQFSNSSFDHGTDYQNQPDVNGISVALSQNFTVDHPNVSNPEGVIHWPIVTANPSQHFLAGYVYDAPNDISVTATVTIPQFYLWGRVTTGEPSAVVVAIILSNPAAGTQNTLASHTFDFSVGYSEDHHQGSGGDKISDTLIKNTTISVSVDIPAGQQLAVTYAFQGKTPASFTIFSGAAWQVVSNIQQLQYGQLIQCERIFPDISQKDLLKDILQKFGIICQTDNTARTVNFASFRDIVNNIPIAKNWTAKCLDQGKSISFQLGGYAQVNYLKYKADNNVLPAGFADAQIIVADKTLPATADLFESQFAPTLNRPYIGGSVAQIKMTDLTDDNHDFNIGVSPRILVDNKIDLRQYGNNAGIKFTDGDASRDVIVNDWVSVPYFYKPDGEYNLCFGDMPGTGGNTLPGLKTLYYPELQKILTLSKKVVRYFLLTPRDILELDLLIPIYLQQDGAYYYINKIDSWRKGQPVKVELVKLG